MSSERRSSPPYLTALLLAVLCSIGLLAYSPGLSGDFLFDDDANIVHNDSIHIHALTPASLKGAALSGHSGPLKRPVSMLSFALNYYFAGLDTFYFKLTNVVIHLLNGIGLFFLTRLILAAYREHHEPRLTDRHLLVLSLAVSAAWLLHPLNLTGVLYVVQRMTSLSALFVIWGLVLYMAGRRRIGHGGRRGMAMILAGVSVFTPLAMLSKENGALLPLFMLLIEYTLFGFQTPQRRERRFLFGLFAITVAAPALAVGAYTLIHPQWILAGYHVRDFDLGQRLLTESRVLWFYIKEILIPSNSQMGLFHDDMTVSQGLFQPRATFFAVAGVGLALAAAVYSRRRAPLVALGVLWFFVGHSLESTFLPLELAYEHRNYLPDYGLLLVTVYYLLYPFAFTRVLRGRQALTAAFVVMLALTTAVRAGDWGNPALHAMTAVEHAPLSPRANNFAGRVYIALANASRRPEVKKKYTLTALTYFEHSARLPGNTLGGSFDTLRTLDGLGQPPDAHVVDNLVDRLEHQPFAYNTANQFTGLVKCEEQDHCHLPLDVVGKLFQAALDNPGLKGRTRSIVLAAAVEHMVNIVGNYREALQLARQAITVQPKDPLSRLNYVKLLIATGNRDLAREQLRKLKALDTWGTYATQIAEQEQILAQANGPLPSPHDVKSDTSNTQIDPPDGPKVQTGA